jgi:hypothetical protein
MAALLVLMGTGGQVWLALALAMLALERGVALVDGRAGVAAGALGASARMLMPGYLAWLAIRGWQPLAPDVAQAISIWRELAVGLGADGQFLLPWLAFTAVAWAMDDRAGLDQDGLRRIVWAGGYGLACLLLASNGAWLAAGAVLMLAAAQGPLLGALGDRRPAWFRQAVQPFGLLALLAVAGSVALRG